MQMPLPDALLMLDIRAIVKQHTAQAGILIAQEILNLEVERLAGPRSP
ncbi:MAG: hypothetical protein N3A38_07540 [Planctomycetota bacterium]|nr:hypothetical protein [Planctomycetota bacterium]